MIREALEYLIGLGKMSKHEINGRTYTTDQLYVVKEPTPDAINLRSLSGLVDYLQSGFDEKTLTGVMIHVTSPTEVKAFSTLNSDASRSHYIQANALLPDIRFGQYYDTESFNILLQSAFIKNDTRTVLLKLASGIVEEDVKTTGDNGTSQMVVAKSGIGNVENVAVPNPVTLHPFRTFVEVLQPASEFVFRIQNGPRCALFEADGGAWKLEAMQNIKRYLVNKLAGPIEKGAVHIIA